MSIKHGAMCLAVMLVGIAFNSSNAGIYKWVDDDGVTHYSDRQGSKATAEQVDIRVAPPAANASKTQERPDYRKMNEEYREKKSEEKKLAQERGAERKKKEQECTNARTRLKRYQNNSRVYRTDPDTGERSYFSDSEYKNALDEAQNNVKKSCN